MAEQEVHLNAPIIKGWLSKRSRHFKSWRRRFVVLQDVTLYTFKEETRVVSRATEEIGLCNVLFVKALADDLEAGSSTPKNDSCFEVRSHDVSFVFNARNRKRMTEWVHFLNLQLFRTQLEVDDNSTINMLQTLAAGATLWVCPTCAFQSAIATKVCSLCGYMQSKHAQIVTRSAKKRSSTSITHEREDEAPEQEQVVVSASVRRWKCQICTYENVPSLPYCEICGTQKQAKPNAHAMPASGEHYTAEQVDALIGAGNECTFVHSECPCVHRIVDVLTYYQKWLRFHAVPPTEVNADDEKQLQTPSAANMTTQQHAMDLAVYQKQVYANDAPFTRMTGRKWSIRSDIDLYRKSMHEFINEILVNYSTLALLNDFNHIVQVHCSQSAEMEAMCEEIVARFAAEDCSCSVLSCVCVQRNHNHNHSDDSNKNTTFYYGADHHSNNNNSRQTVIQQILDRIHCRLLHTFELYTFRASECDEIENASMAHGSHHSQALHLNHPRLHTIKQLILSKKKNLMSIRGRQRLKASKFVSHIKGNDNGHEDEEQIVVDFGTKHYYWNFFASKQSYIAPKYKTFKEELMQNALQQLSMAQYTQLYQKCQLLSHCLRCKHMRAMDANIEQFKYYDINAGDAIGLDHILAISLYVNHDGMCQALLSAVMMTDQTDAIAPHREYRNWARLLRESVECFGGALAKHEQASFTKKLTFYHAVSNQQLLFYENVRFCKPTSTSSALSVCLQYLPLHGDRDDEGLILEVAASMHSVYYLNAAQCAIFSDFPDELESIFAGGHQSLQLKSIINMVACENYKAYLSAIHYLQQLIIGHAPQHKNKRFPKSVCAATQNLVKQQIKRDEDDMKSHTAMLPQYVSNLFHQITLRTMHKITFKINDIEKYFDRSIKRLFVDDEQSWIKMDSVVSLFPNVSTVWIEALHINETTIVKLYSFCERMSQQANSIKYKTNKLREIIIVDAVFNIDTSDEKYMRQIQDLFQQIPWHIALDFNDQTSKGMKIWHDNPV